MTAPVEITYNKKRAKVVDGGALAVLPPEYNKTYSAAIAIPDTPYNVVPSKPDEYFVGNILVITSDKTVSQTVDAIVTIYAAKSADEALTADNLETVTINVPRSDRVVIENMNLRTDLRGAYINAVSSDVNVYVTMFGYYTLEDI